MMEKFEFQISVIESEDLHRGDKHDDLGKVGFQIHTMFIIESIICQSFADTDDPLKTTDQTRRLGLIVCRGTAVMLVSPTEGTDEIPNPFIIQLDGSNPSEGL